MIANEPRRATSMLRLGALVSAAGFLLHNGDHLRRGFDILTPAVLWVGNLSGLVAVVAIGLALGGHRLAAPIAIAHGFSQALGVAAVHLLPPWGALSDSLPAGGVDGLTWAAVLAEIGGALVFGLVGLAALGGDLRRLRATPARS